MTEEEESLYRIKISWCQANALKHMRDALESLGSRDSGAYSFHLSQIEWWRKREKACLAVLNSVNE